jgi:hypothetical protein
MRALRGVESKSVLERYRGKKVGGHELVSDYACDAHSRMKMAIVVRTFSRGHFRGITAPPRDEEATAAQLAALSEEPNPWDGAYQGDDD